MSSLSTQPRAMLYRLIMMQLFGFAVTSTAFATEPRFERIAYHVVSTGSETWQSFNFTALTGVVQFGGWDPALQQRARAHGVRTFSEFGWACLPSQPCTWLANRTEAALRAQAAVDLANQRGADGINIDIEGAGAPSCTAPDLEYFVREVSRRFAGGTTGTIGTNDAVNVEGHRLACKTYEMR